MKSLSQEQLKRLDTVDNACHHLLCELAGQEVEWNIEHIAMLADACEEIVVERLGVMTRMKFRPYIRGV